MFIEVTTQGDKKALINIEQITSIIPMSTKEGCIITLTSTWEESAETFEVKNSYDAVTDTLKQMKNVRVVPTVRSVRLTAQDIMASAPKRD